MIKTYKDYTKDVTEYCDVCIIGSGPGGAVAAKEIAEQGYSVVLVEEGGHYTIKDWDGKPMQSMIDMWRDGGATMTLGIPAVMLPLGKCIGGTSTINSLTCFRTPTNVLMNWQMELGLYHLTMRNLDDIFKKIEKEISVTELPWDRLGNCAKIVKRGADKLGLNCQPLKHNAKNCQGCGTCQFGCIEGAKQSMDVTYIPKAIKYGAKVYANCRADKLIIKKKIVHGVECSFLDPETKEETFKMKVNSKIVVVAAGATYTPTFLKNNKLKNKHIGKHLQIHPGSRVAALMDEKVEGWKGVSQGAFIDNFEDEGIMLEGIFIHPSVLLAAFPYFGKKFKELASQFDKIATFGIMVHDSTEGRVLNISKKSMTSLYFIKKKDVKKLQKGIAYTARIFFAAGAKKVFTPVRMMPELNSMDDVEELLKLKIRPSDIAESMAFHPLGTCKMAQSAKEGVVNKYGETFEVKNLYITDASIIPTSLGVNPQITIMALSTLVAKAIVNRLSTESLFM